MLEAISILILALVTLHILDQYSTRTLLNIEVLWHDNPEMREKMNEQRLERNPLHLEQNRWVRYLVKRYGVHKGLNIASVITIILFCIFIASIINLLEKGVITSYELTFYGLGISFVLGFIFHQFANAVGRKRELNKLKSVEKKANKNNKKFLVFALFFITATFIVIIFGASYNASTWTKTYRLNDQFIASIPASGTSDLAPCNDCLIMKVQDEWWTPGGLMTQNLTFFFANEHNLRDDLQSGDLINVRWKLIGGKRFIRGVQKVND